MIQPHSGPNRKHRPSVDMGGEVSRVPLQRHCTPGAGPRGNTAFRSSPIFTRRLRRRDVFLCCMCNHRYTDKFLMFRNLVTAICMLHCSLRKVIRRK
jgi:hypothetical protein